MLPSSRHAVLGWWDDIDKQVCCPISAGPNPSLLYLLFSSTLWCIYIAVVIMEDHTYASTSSLDVPSSSNSLPPVESSSTSTSNSSNSYSCVQCDYATTRKDKLRRHMKTKHDFALPLENKGTTQCQHPDCSDTFYHKSKMFLHMTEAHGCELNKESHQFNSYEEFMQWKQKMEADGLIGINSEC